MGRGRAKAKQTKVARDLKYRQQDTDFGALARVLHGDEGNCSAPAEAAVEDHDEWSDYADPRRRD